MATKCLACRTSSGRRTRGLCDKCYSDARRAIRRGDITEAILLRRGLMAKVSRAGRRPSSLITRLAKKGKR